MIMEPNNISQQNKDNAIASIIYSQGRYFLYNAKDLDFKRDDKEIHNFREEMSSVLKELSKKVYLVIKNMNLNQQKQQKSKQYLEDYDNNKVNLFFIFRLYQGTIL